MRRAAFPGTRPKRWKRTCRACTSLASSPPGSMPTRSSSRTGASMVDGSATTSKANPPELPLGGDRLLDIVRPRTRCERDEAVGLRSKNGACRVMTITTAHSEYLDSAIYRKMHVSEHNTVCLKSY